MNTNEKTYDDHEKEIKHPTHTHPLELCNFSSYGKCLICRKDLDYEGYSCRPCGFRLCTDCVKKPLVVDPKRSHEHQLTLVPKPSFIFTCDACGVGDISSSLCLCIPCCFTIHWDCIDLPRVICINRHDHRISLVHPLGSGPFGEWSCGVCRKNVNGMYGAYFCSKCLYVVHSRCATRLDLWDGIELEGVPEEDPRDIMPFVEIEEGVIKHCSHEHNLRLILHEDGDGIHDMNIQCNACILPIYSDSCYVCTQGCDFILHEVCANFLKKKRHFTHPQRLTLITETKEYSSRGFYLCFCCRQIRTGFTYVYGEDFSIDVQCASIADGYVHGSHHHKELVISDDDATCLSCDNIRSYVLTCTESGCEDFILCFHCATLPDVVKHKYDKHPISLRYGENTESVYWCEICEKTLNPRKWFYTCDDCSSTLHINCVLGLNPSFRFGSTFQEGKIEAEVVLNNYVTRPHCHYCSSRCEGPSVFKTKDLFYCCLFCLQYVWVLKCKRV